MFMIHRAIASCLLFVAVYLHNLGCSDAAQIVECKDSGVIEVVENSTGSTLTCLQYTGTVTWTYSRTGLSTQVIGTCGASPCSLRPQFTSLLSLTYLSPSSSSMTITYTARDLGGVTFTCSSSGGSGNCAVDITVPAEVSPVNLTVVRSSSGWTLQGIVNITTIYSSLGRYSCEWFQRIGDGSDSALTGVTLSLSPDPNNTTNTHNRSGSCTWSTPLRTDPVTFLYRVLVSPDPSANGTTGNIKIDRPTIPVVSCSPSAYVPQNTTLQCACNTQNIGKPEGRLIWYKGNSVINSGVYGVSGLSMTPQTLTLSDHGVTQFRCDVNWAEDIRGNAYTASVGYAPTATDLNISPSIASENQAVTIDCHADGRPTPNMTLIRQDKNVVVRTGPSPLSYTISSAQCEDNAVYVCTAVNGMGPDQEDTASLIVKCKPHIETIPLPDVIVKLNDQPVTFSFDVTAYPVPDNFTFTFLTPDSNMKTSTYLSQGVTMNAACGGKPGSLYRATCIVTLSSIRSEDEVGVYRLRVANSQGFQDYAFQIRTEQTGEQSGSNSAESARSAAIGLGVALAIVLVTNVIIGLWLWRRNWTLPCSEKNPAKKKTQLWETAKGERSAPRLSARDASVKEERQGQASYSNRAEQTGPYDSLQMQDVGMRSPYAEISYHGDR